ncbi:MAG: class I SAM-dependent methyltransferase [Actinoallomurus sp.]
MTDLQDAIATIEHDQASPESVRQAELAASVDEVVRATALAYSEQSDSYAEVRQAQPWSWDIHLTATLLEQMRERVSDGTVRMDGRRWRLLDVGAGYGRDIFTFAQESDVEPVALENAEGFVSHLRQAQADGRIGRDGVVVADMRDLGAIADASFQCVRAHATLHHLPEVSYGLGADQAVAEFRRVLVSGGLCYVTVKAGTGIDLIDTGEGLGGRFFQLFSPEQLTKLLERHGLSVVRLEEAVEHRTSGDVPWIFALAVAE